MQRTPPARVGDHPSDVQTPALLVDLDTLDDNIASMAHQATAAGLALRPHAKTHKSVAIARRQLLEGAAGLCCQKVSEAEALLESGVEDMLISNHIVAAQPLRRMAALARRLRITTLIAESAQIDLLAAAADYAGATIEVLVEIDAGDRRMGVADSEAILGLAEEVERRHGLHFRGLQAYNGPLQHLREQEERSHAAREAAHRAATLRDRLERRGIACPLITGGGTGSFATDLSTGAFTEIQPGSYVFMDLDYGRNRTGEDEPYQPFRQSLFVLSTVINRAPRGAVYVDAGAKALNLDCGPPDVWGSAGLAYTKASDEQGRIEIAPGTLPPQLGEQLLLIPSHCDPTVNLFDWMVGIRGDRVEEVWPIEARGCLS